MYTRKFTYEDYNGVERTEDFYFNLTKSDIIKWLTTNGGYTLDALIEKLGQEQNGKEIMRIFEELIVMSCGKRSLDGRRFDKSEEAKRDFLETAAYDQLFTELVTDASKAAEFINQIIPKDMAAEIAKIMAENSDGVPDALKDYTLPAN